MIHIDIFMYGELEPYSKCFRLCNRPNEHYCICYKIAHLLPELYADYLSNNDDHHYVGWILNLLDES